MDEANESDVENAIGKEFVQVGNSKVTQNALEELTRIDVAELDHDESVAYADVIEGLTYLRESLSEEKRRPNAKVQPWGSPDDD